MMDSTGIIIIVYFLIVLLIGFYGNRKMKSRASFFVADRKLGLATTSATLAATVIGGSSTIGLSVFIQKYGLAGIWLEIGGSLGLLVLSLTLASKVRKTGVYSLPELMERLFNSRVRLVTAILVQIVEIAWLGLLIQAMEVMLVGSLKMNPGAALFLSVGICICYTFISGQFAVAYTDVVQFVIMLVGICFIAAPAVFLTAGGFSGLSALSDRMLSFPFNESMDPIHAIAMLLLMGLPHLVGPDVYSKVLSAKTEQAARGAAAVAGVFKMLFGLAVAVIILSACVILPNQPVHDAFLPEIIMLSTPPWASGIIVAAFLATIMSSASSVLLTGGTVFTNDIYSRYIHPNADDRLLMKISRTSIVVIGGLAFLLAVHLQDIINTLTLAYTLFASSAIIPIIAGFYKDRTKVTPAGVSAAMLSGGLSSLLCWILDTYTTLHPPVDPILIGMVFCAGVLFGYGPVRKVLKRKINKEVL